MPMKNSVNRKTILMQLNSSIVNKEMCVKETPILVTCFFKYNYIKLKGKEGEEKRKT